MAARNTLRRALLYGECLILVELRRRAFPAITIQLPTLQVLDGCKAGGSREILTLTTSVVPGSSQRFLDKSRGLTADCVAYDLEDSVTPHKKAEARNLVRRALDQPAPAGIRERAVRINSVESGLALGDLTEVVSYASIQLNNL